MMVPPLSTNVALCNGIFNVIPFYNTKFFNSNKTWDINSFYEVSRIIVVQVEMFVSSIFLIQNFHFGL
jgi:hypothetical protein